MSHSNLELLQEAATKLRALLPEIVFLGGCMTQVLITDSAAPEVRPTDDVDVVTEIASYEEYVGRLSAQLRALGFVEDHRRGAPICRWLHGPLVVDFMAVHPKVMGFSNRWYAEVLTTAKEKRLPSASPFALSMHPISWPLSWRHSTIAAGTISS